MGALDDLSDAAYCAALQCIHLPLVCPALTDEWEEVDRPGLHKNRGALTVKQVAEALQNAFAVTPEQHDEIVKREGDVRPAVLKQLRCRLLWAATDSHPVFSPAHFLPGREEEYACWKESEMKRCSALCRHVAMSMGEFHGGTVDVAVVETRIYAPPPRASKAKSTLDSVAAALSLGAEASGEFQQLYFVVAIGQTKKKTPAVHLSDDGKSALLYASCDFEVSGADDVLVVTAKYKNQADKKARPYILGQVTVPVTELADEKSHDVWLPLQAPPSSGGQIDEIWSKLVARPVGSVLSAAGAIPAGGKDDGPPAEVHLQLRLRPIDTISDIGDSVDALASRANPCDMHALLCDMLFDSRAPGEPWAHAAMWLLEEHRQRHGVMEAHCDAITLECLARKSGAQPANASRLEALLSKVRKKPPVLKEDKDIIEGAEAHLRVMIGSWLKNFKKAFPREQSANLEAAVEMYQMLHGKSEETTAALRNFVEQTSLQGYASIVVPPVQVEALVAVFDHIETEAARDMDFTRFAFPADVPVAALTLGCIGERLFRDLSKALFIRMATGSGLDGQGQHLLKTGLRAQALHIYFQKLGLPKEDKDVILHALRGFEPVVLGALFTPVLHAWLAEARGIMDRLSREAVDLDTFIPTDERGNVFYSMSATSVVEACGQAVSFVKKFDARLLPQRVACELGVIVCNTFKSYVNGLMSACLRINDARRAAREREREEAIAQLRAQSTTARAVAGTVAGGLRGLGSLAASVVDTGLGKVYGVRAPEEEHTQEDSLEVTGEICVIVSNMEYAWSALEDLYADVECKAASIGRDSTASLPLTCRATVDEEHDGAVAEDGTVVEVLVERERRLTCWSQFDEESLVVFGDTYPPVADALGHPRPPRSAGHVPRDARWEWVDDAWCLESSESKDEHGWQYGTCWEGPWMAHPDDTCFVRGRVWKRRRTQAKAHVVEDLPVDEAEKRVPVDVVDIDVFLNERKPSILSPFSAKGLQASESRITYTDGSPATFAAGKHGVMQNAQSLDNVPLPSSPAGDWSWASEWSLETVDARGVEAFMYATDFGEEFFPSVWPGAWVRRQRWTRSALRSASASELLERAAHGHDVRGSDMEAPEEQGTAARGPTLCSYDELEGTYTSTSAFINATVSATVSMLSAPTRAAVAALMEQLLRDLTIEALPVTPPRELTEPLAREHHRNGVASIMEELSRLKFHMDYVNLPVFARVCRDAWAEAFLHVSSIVYPCLPHLSQLAVHLIQQTFMVLREKIVKLVGPAAERITEGLDKDCSSVLLITQHRELPTGTLVDYARALADDGTLPAGSNYSYLKKADIMALLEARNVHPEALEDFEFEELIVSEDTASIPTHRNGIAEEEEGKEEEASSTVEADYVPAVATVIEDAVGEDTPEATTAGESAATPAPAPAPAAAPAAAAEEDVGAEPVEAVEETKDDAPWFASFEGDFFPCHVVYSSIPGGSYEGVGLQDDDLVLLSRDTVSVSVSEVIKIVGSGSKLNIVLLSEDTIALTNLAASDAAFLSSALQSKASELSPMYRLHNRKRKS